MTNISDIAIEILKRASISIGTIFGKNPDLITFLWNHEDKASDEVRKAIREAQAYAKSDADCYANLAGIDANTLYQAIDDAADILHDDMRTEYFENLMHSTCFEQEGTLFHVIGRVKTIKDSVVTTKTNKVLDLVTISVAYEDGCDVSDLTLTFWDEDAIQAFCDFQRGDIICVNGSIHKRRYGRKWFTNYTAKEFSMFATATPDDYMPSEHFAATPATEPSDRQYDVRIWGRKGHYRRMRNGEIGYVRPCVCHRNPAFAVAVEQA